MVLFSPLFPRSALASTHNTVLDKSIRRLVRGAAGVREVKLST